MALVNLQAALGEGMMKDDPRLTGPHALLSKLFIESESFDVYGWEIVEP